jgi:hypothetical protein
MHTDTEADLGADWLVQALAQVGLLCYCSGRCLSPGKADSLDMEPESKAGLGVCTALAQVGWLSFARAQTKQALSA